MDVERAMVSALFFKTRKKVQKALYMTWNARRVNFNAQYASFGPALKRKEWRKRLVEVG